MAKIIFLFFFFSILFSLGLSTDLDIIRNLREEVKPKPANWLGHPCNWAGIQCSGSGKYARVQSIDMSEKQLSGSLNTIGFNQLTELQILNLQENQFSGPIPSFSGLTYLKKLLLNKNNFTSVPPKIFSGLRGLEVLSVSDNYDLEPWSLPEDLTDSTSLGTIYASHCNLMGSIPDFIAGFVSLQDVSLSYNNLTGVLPGNLATSSLKNFSVNNQLIGLSGTLDVIGRMTNLVQVWLYKNMFTGVIPDLSNCTTLQDLQLSDNQLTGVVPSSLMALPALVKISLSDNLLMGEFPTFAKQVNVVISGKNSFCKSEPGPCGSQVITLLMIAEDLGWPAPLANKWVGNDVCQGWTFVTCDVQRKNVTVINLSKQHFKGIISPAFGDLRSLKNVFLNDNYLTGPIPDSFLSLSQLQSIDVSNNNLSGNIPMFPSGKVILKLEGNPLLGENLSSDTPDSFSPDVQHGRHKTDSHRAVIMVIFIILVIVLLIVTSLVVYIYFKKKGAIDQKQDSDESQYFGEGNIKLSFDLLQQATDNFSETNKLGEGGCGRVYKGELRNGTQIAVKKMISDSRTTVKTFEAEIAVLSKVRHRHLVRLLGFCVTGQERLLVYEYMPQGSLSDHLYERNQSNGGSPLTWKQRVLIALDVARGVEYLHNLAREIYVHGDLKPPNILLGDDMRAKLADFGLVRKFPDGKYSHKTENIRGTWGYRPLEYADGGRVTTKMDVYAYGVVLMEMLTGRRAIVNGLPLEEDRHIVTWFQRVLIDKDAFRKHIDPTLDPDEETYGNILTVAELAARCTAHHSQRPEIGHAVNVLAPLVEEWKPSRNASRSLSQASTRYSWDEGTSAMATGQYSHRCAHTVGNRLSSIPAEASQFANTL